MSIRTFIIPGAVAALLAAASPSAHGQAGVLHKRVPSAGVMKPLPSAIPSSPGPSITTHAGGQKATGPTGGVPSVTSKPRGLEQASRVAAPQAASGLEQAARASAKAGEKLPQANGAVKAGESVAKGLSARAGEVSGAAPSAGNGAPSAAPEAIQRVGHQVPVTTPRWRDRFRVAKPFLTK